MTAKTKPNEDNRLDDALALCDSAEALREWATQMAQQMARHRKPGEVVPKVDDIVALLQEDCATLKARQHPQRRGQAH